MKTLTIDPEELTALVAACDHWKYRLGAKPTLSQSPAEVKRADCSGFSRYLLGKLTGGAFILPHGSVNQREFLQKQGFKKTAYSNCGLKDGHLRICFLDPASGHGHVWLTYQGLTLECFSGVGVGSRPWNTPVLKKQVDYTFVLT